MSPTSSQPLPSHENISEPLPPIQVVIAFDDQAAYQRALRMLANTFASDPENPEVRPLPWRFDELEFDRWRKRAASDARGADILVISTTRTSALPAAVAGWLENCFGLRRNLATAVVALEDRTSLGSKSDSPWRRFVREAAFAAGMHFIEPVEMPQAIAV